MNDALKINSTSEQIHSFVEAVRRDHPSLVQERMRSVDINACNDLGTTPLMAAAKVSRRDIVQMLIDAGADISAGEPTAKPIHVFAARGWTALVELCMARGERALVTAPKRRSALFEAAMFDNIDTVTAILSGEEWVKSSPADRESHAATAATALHCAQSAEMVELILSYGVDPDGLTTEGESPLFGAARGGRAHVCSALIKHGANVNLDCKGFRPIYFAALYDHPLAMVTLLDAGAVQVNIDDKARDLNQVVVVGGNEVKVALDAWRARKAMLSLVRTTLPGASTAAR